MKLYINGPTERRESKELLLRIADKLPRRFEVLNRDNDDLKVDLYLAEQADALILRTDHYDDATWATIGLARAGQRPIIPLWYHSKEKPHPYGFWTDTHGEKNRNRVRNKKDDREWPPREIKDVIKDVKILEQKRGWRKKRIKKPEKETVNLNLPLYIVGDSRCKENAWSFYDIEKGFNECGISCLIPPKNLDGNYDPKDHPKRIDMSAGDVNDCGDLASHLSSFIVGRSDQKFLLDSRWEEGVAWFHSKPVLYLYQYVFPPRSPYEKYLDRKDPGIHYGSVYKQNEELWDIRVHETKTTETLAGVIQRARNMNETKKIKNKKNYKNAA